MKITSIATDSSFRPRATVVARVGARATVIDVAQGPRLALDAEGRWTAVSDVNGRFRRTVDGVVLRVANSGFEQLEGEGIAAVHGHVVELAGSLKTLIADLNSFDLAVIGSDDDLGERLRDAQLWTAERFAEERRRFAIAYPEPVPILPPHRYRDVVVLPATGCPNHSCTFCDFYRDRLFVALDDDAFDTHLEELMRLFGRALSERGGVFLGSGSALSLSDRVLLRRLARLTERMGEFERGVAAFHNPDLGKRRTVAQWQALRDAGLRDVTVGLETGIPHLREAMHKSSDTGRFVASVADIKAAGIGVAVTVLLGVGAPSDAVAHREATAALIAEMPLDQGDRVYLSPLTEVLSRKESRAEIRRFRAALETRAKVGAYLVERFGYFA